MRSATRGFTALHSVQPLYANKALPALQGLKGGQLFGCG